MFYKVDLSVYPLTPPLPRNIVVTIGDLHSNAMLFLYFLQHYGVISLSEYQYEELFNVYQQIGFHQREKNDLFNDELFTPELKELYEQFLRLISQIKVNRIAFKIRLLGDELADRGECDLFILKILEKLHEKQIDYSILISNHGFAFIACLQFLYLKKHQTPSEIMMSEPESVRSFIYLRRLIKNQFIQFEQLSNLVEKVYYPYLDLLDYGITVNGNDLHIYTHAAMSLEELKLLANDYGISWQNSSVTQLAGTLEQMKTLFKTQKLQEKINFLREIYQIDDPDERFERTQKNLVHTPFWTLLWNRNYSKLVAYQESYNYYVYNVHGHDENLAANNRYYVCLESPLGKCFTMPHESHFKTINKWTYKTLCRREWSLEAYLKHKKPSQDSILSRFGLFSIPSNNIFNFLMITGVAYIFKKEICSILDLRLIQNIFDLLSFNTERSVKLLKN